jgi:hypothetical protein
LDEAITRLANGDPESAEWILRDLGNSTAAFEALTKEIQKQAQSL